MVNLIRDFFKKNNLIFEEINCKNLLQKIEENEKLEAEWSKKYQDLETKFAHQLNFESDLNEKLAQSKNLIDDLNQKLDETKSDLAAKLFEIKNLEDKSKSDIEHIHKIKSEEIEAKSCVYVDRISALEHQIDELNGRLANKDSLVEELNQQVNKLESKLENFQHLVNEKQAQIEKFNTDIKILEEKVKFNIFLI